MIDTVTNAVVATLVVGASPYGVTITPWVEVSPPSLRAYIVNFLSDSVSVIDTGSDEVVATIDEVVATIEVGNLPGWGEGLCNESRGPHCLGNRHWE